MGIENQRAEVAELVDALGSGSSGRTPVRVQIPASAPNEYKGLADSSVNPFSVLAINHINGKHFMGKEITLFILNSHLRDSTFGKSRA